ncbi:MAG: DUF3520 domain-containing protein [Bacteroidetes bacterium]|nr:DUF3520 domain-containing protein [Bacteroidota bacterium]
MEFVSCFLQSRSSPQVSSSGSAHPRLRRRRRAVLARSREPLSTRRPVNRSPAPISIARENFIEGGNNRVILATDVDFNVGVSHTDALIRLIEKEREDGIFLTVLGFGTGNLKDSRMEQIADKGNGNYYYIDQIEEARKVLVDELGSTLYVVAKDVKIQVEFNPLVVASYRLIGYENRALESEDFNDDRKDASDNLGFASAVASFGMLLRNSEYGGNTTSRNVLKLARRHVGDDRFGYRTAFVALVSDYIKLDRAVSSR